MKSVFQQLVDFWIHFTTVLRETYKITNAPPDDGSWTDPPSHQCQSEITQEAMFHTSNNGTGF